jgi:hypothetical protein
MLKCELPSLWRMSQLSDNVHGVVAHHALGTLSSRHGAPGTFEGGFRCFYSSVDIGLASALDLVGDERVIAGIVDGEGLIGLGVCVLQK